MAFNDLFSPIKIRGMEIRNRIEFPAMGTKMVKDEKVVTDQLINYHAARSLGGNGLNFTEVCSVYDKAAPKNFLALSDDKYIPGMKKLADAIHEGGAKAGVQLWLGGSAVLFGDQTSMVVVPSDFKVEGTDYVIKAASKEIINECIKAFGDAARRAVEAGYDTVEFHAGHNYTPHSFLSKAFNKRMDEYGGSLENRARFLLECIKSIRENIPEDMPLFMRIDAHDDCVEDGLTIEEVIQFCKWAKEAGVDVLDVSRGNFSSAAIKYEVPPVDVPRGFNVENAARIKKETGMITVAVGRINDPEQADEIIRSGKADMVVIGRAQLADPEFCNKAKNGNVDDIVRCVGCNQGCYDGFSNPDAPFITCMRNPALGREAEFVIKKTDNPKNVLIVGGGVAGLEAAIELKDRGHNPILCEASDSLGGQFVLAGAAPRKEEMKEAAIAMGEMAKRKGVEIKLSTPVNAEVIKDINPDEVIIAAGAEPIKLNVSGANLPHVTNSHDILAGKARVNGDIVVIGGGLVGLEVAEYLSGNVNKITVVEMLNEVAKDLGQLRKICVMESLYHEGIKTITEAKCVEIKEKSIVIDRNGVVEEVPCDSVIVAIGARSRNFESISDYCKENNIPYHVIGDAVRARRALNCIEEASEVARRI
ncbi:MULTISPECIES: NAD(P)/FAD-dependent oxidoreductase [Clostridium]|uniref:bile acid Fe-S flavoenzyme BaiCD n=1 Tax=Clostridium TaxID=1485 RepID=UPI00115B1361|nr:MULTISPECIES: NAD(P)/FAD-dependent oxidoreductase [Clostridium]MBS5307203.1 FAD-dependent oxidoreductase [Clostridium sp.]MDB1934171.1 NAD(P)/FAD-dependent oxidoreductase [Clostridium tertium]MDB1937330.1 NAD(P)/FAD-dependent oxidoreductase [Clostridium tertium]MDB1945188.1 NAD(P)/FAD-dependent oxidoreductase [Clostridium tertium]MDB1952472.1 NAD(P)/FAD-dependent oxidoreductase [Clostridium tertium]